MSLPTFVIGVGILLALGAVAILALTGIVGIPAAIIAAAIPVSLGLIGQFVSSDQQNKREIEARLRERKSKVYEDFIKFWMDHLMLDENRVKIQRNPNQVAKGINEFSKAMMLWASNDVVQSYADYRRMLLQRQIDVQGNSGIESMIHFEKMLFLMREDMGHDPSGFRKYDLLSFFISDIQKFVELEHDGSAAKKAA